MLMGVKVFLACNRTHLKNSLVPHSSKTRSHFCLLLHLSSCWVTLRQAVLLLDGSASVPRHWRVPLASGPFPQALPPWRCLVYCLAPEAPLIKGMLTGAKVFLALPDVCRPCNQTHLKNGLVPHLYTGGAYDK